LSSSHSSTFFDDARGFDAEEGGGVDLRLILPVGVSLLMRAVWRREAREMGVGGGFDAWAAGESASSWREGEEEEGKDPELESSGGIVVEVEASPCCVLAFLRMDLRLVENVTLGFVSSIFSRIGWVSWFGARTRPSSLPLTFSSLGGHRRGELRLPLLSLPAFLRNGP